MALEWIHDNPPRWDAGKQAIVGGAQDGVFEFGPFDDGQLIPGDWWRVQDGADIVGYGWMDTNWGDAEVLLAVDPAARGRGVGSFILEGLEREAAARGLNYLYNRVRPTHPARDDVSRWLGERGFAPTRDGLLKRRVAQRG